jgi:hypothetical protein
MPGHVQGVTDVRCDAPIGGETIQCFRRVRPVPVVDAIMVGPGMVGLFCQDLLEDQLVAVAVRT